MIRKLYQLQGTKALIEQDSGNMMSKEEAQTFSGKLDEMIAHYEIKFIRNAKKWWKSGRKFGKLYQQNQLVTKVRDKENITELYTESLSGNKIPRVSVPKFEDPGEILRWLLKENLPGYFPYTAGVFPFKRTNEDPKRQFAGEGTPDRTNRRFHFLCQNDEAKRLSTAFDSVTLYGQDPDYRPDIYGKIGNSGVNVCTLDDMKKLYKGFDLMSSVHKCIDDD